jgi:ABC-type enterochelin transport system permease subunit
MTDEAIAYRSRSVHVFQVSLFRMANRTEILFRLNKQLRFIGLVRIVAGGALAALDGFMQVLLGPECGMTHLAELSALLDKFEGLLALLRMRRRDTLMAIVAGLCGGVDILCLQHRRVALAGDARFLSRRLSGKEGRARRCRENDHSQKIETLL